MIEHYLSILVDPRIPIMAYPYALCILSYA